MKNALLLTLSISLTIHLSANAQTNLGVLAELNRLPEGMPQVSKWIEKGMSKVFISGLQHSDSQRGDQRFLSFQKTGSLPLVTSFPVTGVSILHSATPNPKNLRLGKSKTISLTYSYEIQAYLAYSPDKFIYKDRSYAFMLACEVTHLEDSQLIAQILNYLMEGNSKEKATTFIKRINAKYKTVMPLLSGEVDIHALTQQLYKQFSKEKTRQILFGTFILGKDNKATDLQLNRFFNPMSIFGNDDVITKLQDMNDPEIKINIGETAKLLLPNWASPFAAKPADSLISFDFQFATAKFALAEKKLTLVFEGKTSQPAKFVGNKEFLLNPKTRNHDWQNVHKPNEGISLSEISIEIAESAIRIEGRSADERRFLLQTIAWPKEF